MKMILYISEITPIAECECGYRSYGDSINDAVIGWARHVTEVVDHREKLK